MATFRIIGPMRKDESTATPIPNSYWVEPGRLLAGEYPGGVAQPEAIERIQKLLAAGITSFIDLTEAGEMPAYEALLAERAGPRIAYRRLPILDHDVPESAAHMSRIVDAIEQELAAGRCVYVHCRAGIGRTGMTVGCYLIRRGLTNDEAYERLQHLWQQCERSRRWPTIPETPGQIEFLRNWRDSSPELSAGARGEGALIGLAIAEALGARFAHSHFDGATLAQGAQELGGLTTGASTATVRALAESLLACGRHDPEDQMRRYLEWSRSVGLDAVPPEMKKALAAWQWSRKPNAGSHDPKNLDPHTLPRAVAAALFMRDDAAGAIELAAEASRTTQQSPLVLDLCRLWTALLVDALNGVARETLLSFSSPAVQLVRQRPLKAPLKSFLEGRAEPAPERGNDALSVTKIALATFGGTFNLRDAVIQTVSRRASPTAAALCGALAGASYGAQGVPSEWRKELPEEPELRALARQLAS
jgi:protein-tyrosine phosphatase/ADP-ribosylglycohydrolase